MSWWSVLEDCSLVVGGPVPEKLLIILGLYCCESLVVSLLVYVCDLVSALGRAYLSNGVHILLTAFVRQLWRVLLL